MSTVRKPLWLAIILLLGLSCVAWAKSPFIFRGVGGTAPPTGGQTIASVTKFTSATSFSAGVANAVVGTVSVTMSPAAPAFGGTLSITGANSCGFHLSGGTQVQAGAAGCSASGGPHSNGLFDDWNVVATQSGISNSPVTQPEAATAAAPTGIVFNPNPASVVDTAAAGKFVASVTVNMSDGSTYQGGLTIQSCSQSPCPLAIGGTTGSWTTVVANGVGLVDASSQSYTLSTTGSAATPTAVVFNPTSVSVADNTPGGTSLSTLTVNMSDGSTYQGTPTMTSCSQSPCPLAISGSTGNWNVVVTNGVALTDATNQSFTVAAQ